MSDEQRRDSLAEQAAAWIPPWERPPAATPAQPQSDTAPAEESPILDSFRSSGTETVQDPEMVGEPASAGAEEAATPSGQTAAGSWEPAEPETGGPEAEPRERAGRDDRDGTPGQPPTAGEPAAGVPRNRPAGRRRATAVPEPAPVLDDAELRGALEAILLVVDEPVSELTLAQVLDQSPERIGPVLDDIAAGYTAAGHGFELRQAAGGWRLYTRPEYAEHVERFVLDGQSVRLTQAALETLAVIAYKQPVTRSRISAIRGVNCDGVIRTLVSRGLVEECGTESDSGAFLYRTTTLFLEKLGLDSVADLPPLAPFLPDDVEELADATR
ncbi:SMC-Scp complex subunit ScpB [Micromonospora siamensis]|uniref:Segregation and condensation protein B n=1 Tax=Micromonospora siamensis TaxID=299152 RepID=A0A1C5I579_9ACTN|nr:SMC-Scp complex subunit ScpB [Micromonospora siamensis]SCG53542.1 segregation and condensation protein B [Micromonospora siamensis]